MPLTESARRAYWKANLRLMASLLVIWFLVSCVGGILLADQLDKVNLPGTGVPLGFWIAHQGSIVVFVLLVAIYALGMNRLDRRFGVAE